MAYNNMNNQPEDYPGAAVYAPPQSYPGHTYPGTSYPGQAHPQSPEYGWKPNAPSPNPPTTSSGTAPFIDPEDLQPKNMSFSDESIRKGFIRKVYLILMGQLMFTFSIVALFCYHEPLANYSRTHPKIVMGACIVTLVVVIAMACCETARRTFPTNFICLGIFTIAESFLVGSIASRYEPYSVITAVGITAILCLTLTIFACQTKYDFTACGGILLTALVVLLIFGILTMFFPSNAVRTAYASCGAFLACIFLIYDTQLMMGGDHKYSISPEEYIFAALNLYMDVVRIFLYILQLLGNKK